MDEQYKKDRARQEKISNTIGISVTVALHLCLVCIGVSSGMKYLYPPPAEESLLLDFSDYEAEVPDEIRIGREPRSEEADPERETELIQQSQAQLEGESLNEAQEAVVDDFGDVETEQPPRKPEIDRRALFPAADNKTEKDTLAPQVADRISEALKAGHAMGNTETGETKGEPNAKLPGRSVLGTLDKPEYSIQASGKVVVEIWVDRDGNVTDAVPGATGTTVTEKTLWEAARKAALKAHFNVKKDAPEKQKGTITYIFRLESE